MVKFNVKFHLGRTSLRNPIEFCMKKPATHLPSNYRGIYGHFVLNEDKNFENQEKNQNAEEGSSREVHVIRDNDGNEIDLNFPPTNLNI